MRTCVCVNVCERDVYICVWNGLNERWNLILPASVAQLKYEWEGENQHGFFHPTPKNQQQHDCLSVSFVSQNVKP